MGRNGSAKMPKVNRVLQDDTNLDGLLELTRCGQTALRVREDSMEPELSVGQVVGIAFGRLFLPGDVVVLLDRSEGVLHVHRLLGYRRWQGQWAAVAAGDNSTTVDAPVPLSEVVGRVSYADLTITVMDRVYAAGRFLRSVGKTVERQLTRER